MKLKIKALRSIVKTRKHIRQYLAWREVNRKIPRTIKKVEPNKQHCPHCGSFLREVTTPLKGVDGEPLKPLEDHLLRFERCEGCERFQIGTPVGEL